MTLAGFPASAQMALQVRRPPGSPTLGVPMRPIAAAIRFAGPISFASAIILPAVTAAAPSFLPHVDYEIAPVTIGVGFGDLDHDGDADMIAATVTGSIVTVFL